MSAKIGSNTHGYPMPDIDFTYLYLTYNLDKYCSSCGIGLKQKGAFRLKNIPKKGVKKIFRLGWVNDELFVEKSLYEKVFKPLKIAYKEVLVHKKIFLLKVLFN